MISVELPMDLSPYVGKELGASSWRTISEAEILRFAELSGDRHWTHTDPERARRETPFGGIIAQGFFTLSLLTAMNGECFEVKKAQRWFNYGLDRLRFTHPVVPGDRLRVKAVLAELAPVEGGGTRIKVTSTMEIEGKPKPALIAEMVMIAYA